MCNHPLINTNNNTCVTCGAPIQPIQPAAARAARLIADDLYQIALHDYNQPRAWRERVIKDYQTESKAMVATCTDGRTVKQIVDHLVFDLFCRNWAWRGNTLCVTNAVLECAYTLHRDYKDYLLVALRWVDPLGNH